MKTLKSGLIAIALLFVGVASNAVESAKGAKMTKDAVVSTYIDAISTGNTKALSKILADDMQFNMQRGSNINTINKETLLDNIGNSAAVAPVKTSTSVMQVDDNTEKVQITFNYEGYARTDVITLNHTNDWSISNVTSSYN